MKQSLPIQLKRKCRFLTNLIIDSFFQKNSYLFLLVILSACGGDDASRKKNPEVPDLSAIVERQAFLLDSLGVTSDKIVALNQKKDTIENAEIDWQEELEIFKEADISDQRFASMYRKEVQDSGKILLQQVEGGNEPVEFFRYCLSDGRISEIEAKISSENLLYERNLWMRLEFEEAGDQWLVSSYRIVTYTDVLLAGTRDYSVQGEPNLETR